MKKTENKTINALTKMVLRDINTLRTNMNVVRRNPTDILIAIQFDDGHIHTILPHMEVVRSMVNVLLMQLDEYDRKDEIQQEPRPIPTPPIRPVSLEEGKKNIDEKAEKREDQENKTE